MSQVATGVERPVEKIGLPPPEQNSRVSTPVAIDLGAAGPAVLDPPVVVDVRVPVRTIPEQPNTSSPQPSTQGSGRPPAEATASFDISNPQRVGVESPPERSIPTPPGGADNGSTAPTSTLLGSETAGIGRRGVVDRPVKGRPVVGPLDQVAGVPTDMSQVASPRSTSSVDGVPASSPSVPGSVTAITVDRIMEAIEVQRAGPQPDAVLVDIPEMDGLQLRVALRGTEVAITRTSVQGSTENVRPMLIELGSALANKGFSLAGDRRGGGQNDQPERPYTSESDQRHQRRRAVNRRGIQL
ncbi:hypothetical protein BMS3Bbin02_00438 [bacterium BMS3Bbin02]|nr:hypothetical protein BMS3Bbin02_00438 [bacterium BMS3Bbin02]